MRRFKIRFLKGVSLLAVLMLVTAACAADEPAATDAPVATEAAMLGGELEVVANWGADSGEGESIAAVIAAFEAESGVDVSYSGLGDDLATILSTRVEAGDSPDVAFLPQPGLLKDLATKGALSSIEDAVGADVDANYASVWRELGSADGTLYGVWFKGANKSTVWYDVKVFDELGITAPATWDEWLAVSSTLLDNGVTPLAIGGADGWTLSDWFENILVRTAGQEFYEQLTAHEVSWEDPAVKVAFEVMGELLTDENIAGGTAGGLQMGFVDSITAVFGANPQAAVMYEGDFVGGIIGTETEAQAGTDYNFFAFPSIDGSPNAVLGGGDVAVTLTGTDQANAFLKFLASAEAAEIWAARGGFSSPNKNVDLSVYPDDLARASAGALANAEIFVFDLSDLVPSALGGTAGAGIWGQLQEYVGTPGDIDSILEQLEAEAVAAHGG